MQPEKIKKTTTHMAKKKIHVWGKAAEFLRFPD